MQIEDRRSGWPKRDIWMDRPAEVAAYKSLLIKPASSEVLVKRLDALDIAADRETLAQLAAGWRADGLAFEDEGMYVALASTGEPPPDPGPYSSGWDRGLPSSAIAGLATTSRRATRSTGSHWMHCSR